MKVTLIGHATLLVEMEGLRCLMDPVLQEPFEEGAVESCPRREVAFDKLPPVDLAIISHRHLDHFDIPTLARLPRKCEVMCPRDHAIAYVLQELGFSRVHQVDSMSIREFPGYEMAITRSENRDCEEFGVLFKDKSGTFWNQVDSMPSLRRLEPSIDTCLANPGDEFIIQKGKVQHRKGASPFVRMVEDDTHRIRFDPTAPIPPLVDQNPQGYPAERLTRAVEELGEGLAAWFRTGQASGDAVLAEHQKHRVRYLLRGVFPDGSVRRYRFVFGEKEAAVEVGAPENAPADTVHSITASALTAWMAREKSFFYLRGYSRRFTTLHTVARAGDRAAVEPRPVTDLLVHYLMRASKGADMALKQRLDRELALHRRA